MRRNLGVAKAPCSCNRETARPRAGCERQASTAGHLSEHAWPSAQSGPTERGLPRRATPPAENCGGGGGQSQGPSGLRPALLAELALRAS
eukprot:8430931-Alexandrium_andersonii.AAC.1